MGQLNRDRVVRTFKALKPRAYREYGPVGAEVAFAHVARVFNITVTEVKRIVWEAKPSNRKHE